MARRLHLHIGTMKSATTYLQDLCELHQDHLADAGVAWPAGAVRYAGIRAFFGRADDLDPPAAWASLLRQVRGHSGDVLLSNELLAGLEPRRVGRLVEAFAPTAVHVVVTARDPARVIPSAWQTAIRNGDKTYSWAEFSASVCSDPADPPTDSIHRKFWHHHDVPRIVSRWQPFVGTDLVTVVTVPPDGGDRELVARRFGAAIGVDLAGLAQPTSRGNSTLGAHSTELLRRINLSLPGIDGAARKYGIRNALADSALGARAKLEPEFGLSAEHHAWAVGRARRLVEELRGMDLLVEGDLTDLIPTTQPSIEVVDPGDTTDEELLDAALAGLIGMARHTAKYRLKSNQLRDELEQLKAERDETSQRNGLAAVRAILGRIRR